MICWLSLVVSLSFSQTTVSADQLKINVLVVYYSSTGNTEKMANAVVEGAKKIPGVEAVAKTPDKVGGAFATGGSETGGKEQVIHSLITSLLNAGMIIAGPLNGPFGMVGVTALDPVNETALKEAMALGERVANVASLLKK